MRFLNALVFAVASSLLFAGSLRADDAAAKPATTLTFEADIFPILQARCAKCHGEEKLEAGLDVRRRFAILKGGDTGPAFVEGKPDESTLIERIEKNEMPPVDEGRLDDKQKALIRQWVLAGAPTLKSPEPPLEESEIASRISDEDRQFWSFKPPIRPAVPVVKSLDRVRTAIDSFLLEKLEAKGLAFNPDAPREVQVRRLYLDLWGIPPTIEQANEYLQDERPDAYELLVDRLLAAPQYGERWGRHWLDVAGYADSDGYLAADRLRPEAWRYRDYVIEALNRDLPYDQFVREQLAGDELSDWRRGEEISPEVERQLRATGFLRTAMDPTYPGYVEPNEVHQVLADTVQIVSSTFLGLTVQCARCHSHKFDPISQRDYYSMQAVLLGAYDPARWQPSEVRGIPLATEAQEARINELNKKADERVAALTATSTELTTRFRKRRIVEILSAATPGVAVDPTLVDKLLAAVAVATDKQNPEQKELVARHLPGTVWTDDELTKRYAEYGEDQVRLKAAIAAEAALKKTIVKLRSLGDVDDKPAEGRILRRGEHTKPGGTVTANVPEVLTTVGFQLEVKPGYKTSGRRLAFARWLTEPNHPLLSRVQANRIWARHFGRGLVPTLANFGRSGVKPSHPELLDWLATEFVAMGWSQKALHKLMVTSTAYRQSVDMEPAKTAADPENKLWGAWQPRRVEGEVVRDGLLAVSGKLNPEMLGSPVNVTGSGDGAIIDVDNAGGRRRSIYQIVRRSQHMTMLDLFDTPLMEVNCPERTVSIVPLQALAMLHGPQAERASLGLSERVLAAAATDEERLVWIFRTLLTRTPRPTEQQNFQSFLAEIRKEQLLNKTAPTAEDQLAATRVAWKEAALVLLNSNEFLFVH